MKTSSKLVTNMFRFSVATFGHTGIARTCRWSSGASVSLCLTRNSYAFMGKTWENRGKTMGKPWENIDKTNMN